MRLHRLNAAPALAILLSSNRCRRCTSALLSDADALTAEQAAKAPLDLTPRRQQISYVNHLTLLKTVTKISAPTSWILL
ncbi:MAG: hypothetical protein ACLQJR_07915 [Stellaceae bacterium]